MRVNIELPRTLDTIVTHIRTEGGTSYLVGGAIVDYFQEKPLKDWDIEVHGLSYTHLQTILARYGTQKLVGANFGHIIMRLEGTEYEFSLPRRETSNGIKETDFDPDLVPHIAPHEAAACRELTMNSMYVNLETLELDDPFHGLADLDAGLLRHTSTRFADDPNRVFRIMQLLPRKGKKVHPDTIELCRTLSPQFKYIDKERIFKEWNKLLFNCDQPSLGLQFLEESGWMTHFPELDQLRSIDYHAEGQREGTLWDHTLLVVDRAAALRSYLPEAWQQAYMYAALLHRVGQTVTATPESTSPGQDAKTLARTFMHRILKGNDDLVDKVALLVDAHTVAWQLYSTDAPTSAWKRLHNAAPLYVLASLSRAEAVGRQDSPLSTPYSLSERILAYSKEFGQKKIPHIVTGDDIMALGILQGPRVGEIVQYAYDLQLDEDITDKNILLERVKTEYLA